MYAHALASARAGLAASTEREGLAARRPGLGAARQRASDLPARGRNQTAELSDAGDGEVEVEVEEEAGSTGEPCEEAVAEESYDVAEPGEEADEGAAELEGEQNGWHDDDNAEADVGLEDVEEPEDDQAEEQVSDDSLPRREDDLSLDDVPEDQREAVEGNITLKRMLSTDSMSSLLHKAKKRKLNGGEMQALRVLDPLREELLSKWRLVGDVAARYVLEAAEAEEIESLRSSSWFPNRSDPKKSCAEQINNVIIRAREDKCPPGGSVDIVSAFKHRWRLSSADDKLLRGLNHKDLRYVMHEYDGSRPIDELVSEAAMTLPAEERTVDAAPEKPGLITVGRFNRLELIDPVADALVVGDANLTFSLLLAQHREGLGHVGRIVATTFETIETLRERYTEIDATVKILEDKSAEVLHNVDCTRLAVDPRFLGMKDKFGAVYYNFPHAGVVQGFFDGHPYVRWRHENLMQLFFRALRAFVKPGGSVKVSSNSNATGVRYSDIMSAAALSEFVHVETVPFLEWHLQGYRRSYGDRRDANRRPEDGETYKSQRAASDMVYAFRYAPSGETPPKPRIRYPPAKQDFITSKEGNFRGLVGEAKRHKVEEIYQLFLSYVQGIHIG